MIKLPFVLVFIGCLLFGRAARCQVRANMPADTLFQLAHKPMLPNRKPLSAAWLLVPAALTGYGVISLKSHNLQQINMNTKEEIWNENPHKTVKIDSYIQFAPAAAVYALNIAGVHGKNDFMDRTIIYGISEIMVTGIIQGGKKLSAEWRPDSSAQTSFPSGHTATAFAAAEFLRREYWDASPWYGIAGYAVAATTGYLRMYNNKHWLGDVVAGAGVGILSTNFAYFIYPQIKKIFSKHANGATIVMPAYNNGSFQMALLHHF